MTVVQEEIPVKNSAPETVTMRFTRHGPVIADDAKKRHRVLRALGVVRAGHLGVLRVDLLHARGQLEGVRRRAVALGRARARTRSTPTGAGHIGWKPCGFSPVRRNWDGLLPVPGDGRYEWDGFLDADKLPVSRDPDRGWIATANAENLPRGYPYKRRKIGFEWAAPFRLRRIQQVLRRERNGTRRRLAAAAGRPPLACRRRAPSRCSREVETDDKPAQARDPAAAPLGQAAWSPTRPPPRCSRSGTRSRCRPRC